MPVTEGEPVERPQDLIDAIAGHEPGDRITLTVFRPNEENGEEELEVVARLAEHPDEEGKAYLGVRLGGFFHVIGIEGEEGFDEAHPFRFHFDWEAPFDDLPFDPEELPRRFEFRFPPRLFEDNGQSGEGSI